MLTLARFSIKRPKAALAAWLLTAIALTLIGFGVSKSLSPSITVVPGTQSSRATQLANAQFGPSQLVPILLEGPKAQLDRQGPKLVGALTKRGHTRVLSAWDAGTASVGMRPKPTAAMIVVSVDRTEKNVVQYDQPQIQNLVSRYASGGVRAYITGQPSIDRALKDASITNLRQTELIAIGLIFLLLLVGLRAPVAALLVTVVGAVSMLAGFGEVALLGRVLKLDPVGVALGTMTGLALGTGFALLILDRFHREEFPEGTPPRDAASAAIRELGTTGRAVLVGGTALVVALAVVAAVGPSELMISLGTGMLTCAMFATGGAVVVMPAALVLLGRRIDALRFPAPPLLTRAWSGLLDGGNWVTRHAVYTGFGATVLLALIAVPALALNSGPPDVSQLPAGSSARIAFQEISRVMGPGWATPYNVIVYSPTRPITTPALLLGMERFQEQIAKDSTAYSVVGPGAINSTSSQLKKFGPSLAHSAKVSDQSKKDLVTLINGLGQAGTGSATLQSGLLQAASGANALNSGSGQAQSGASKLHAGLATAKTGSQTLAAGLTTALSGAEKLKTGAAAALAGSAQLTTGLGQAATPVKAGLPAVGALAGDSASASQEIAALTGTAQSAAGAVSTASSALAGLGAAAKNDPNYQAAVNALAQARASATAVSGGLGAASHTAAAAAFLAAAVRSQVNQLSPGLDKLQTGAAALQAGISQLRDGNSQLASGIGQLSGGGGQLTSGIGQLTNGAGQLQTGLSQLTSGTGQLASGLAPAPGGAGQLVNGLGQMQAAVVKARGQIPSTKDLVTLQKQSPGLFSSGYFVLAAVEGALPSDRNAATFTINLLRGATAGQIMVVSKYKANDPRTEALGTKLVTLGEQFGKANGAQVAVGGPAGNLGDLTSVTKSRVPLAIASLVFALWLVLAVALRAVVLPAVTTAFSLLVAGASFGVLQLLFGGSNPPLGGPGYLDPMSILGIFTVVFGISVTYSTLLLMSTREAYVAGAGGKQAVRSALRQTAAASTGAGLVMVAALIPFATTQLINVRQFGIGVAVAILLEVFLVRPVLLPAAEAVLGRVGWWPTVGPETSHTPSATGTTRRRPRLHLPHRVPRPAHR